MSKKYKIRVLPLFYKDLYKITNYIAYNLKNKIAAECLLGTIKLRLKERFDNLEQYEKYTSSRKRKRPYYRIYIKNYTIFYTINDDTIEIRRMLYSKRNFNNLI